MVLVKGYWRWVDENWWISRLEFIFCMFVVFRKRLLGVGSVVKWICFFKCCVFFKMVYWKEIVYWWKKFRYIGVYWFKVDVVCCEVSVV